MHKAIKIIFYGSLSLAATALFGVALLYLWPLQDGDLTNSLPRTLSYEEAKITASKQLQQEKEDTGIKPECRSKLYDHGTKTDKAVVMLHGYTGCSKQYKKLAQIFFERGYNVYVPLAPHHGRFEVGAHSQVEAEGLVSYTNDAVNVATGLGDSVGIIGVSGGAVLATWAAEYRNDAVKRLLVLSPFYRPSAAEAPAWQIKPLTVLYGFGLLPDRFSQPNRQGFSFHALSQYLRIVANYKDESELDGIHLDAIALVTTPNDAVIDLAKAKETPATLAKQSDSPYRTYEIPDNWHVGHDIVSPDGQEINGRANELYPIYVDLYESRAP